MHAQHDSNHPMRELSWPWQQLCVLIVAEWWRVPDDYKRELCAIFAAPLGPGNTPLCWILCNSIRRYRVRLHSCILFELQRFYTRLLPEVWARYFLQHQFEAFPEGADKSILFGFLFPLDYWLQAKNLYTQPTHEADNELFSVYLQVVLTGFTGIDYLALTCAHSSSASAKIESADWRRRRK